MKIEIELDNLSKEEQETVRQLAEKKKKPYWVPEYMDEYFRVDTCGNIICDVKDADGYDRFNLSIGNCFRTEEEAKEALIRIQMQAKWKRLSLEAGEADNPWDGMHGHWEVNYYGIGGIDYYEMTTCQDGAVHFPTRASLKAAIAKLGEENIKRYILGVKE